MSLSIRHVAAHGALAFLTVLVAALSPAQSTSASVAGVVQDEAGGALARAAVTLTSITQGYAMAAETDAQGRFVFAVVEPGSYALRVSLESFRTAGRARLVVAANERFSAGTITLAIGAREDSVSVTARVSELQSQSGERAFSLDGETLRGIANNGRSPFGFVTLVPGVLPQGAAGFTIDAADGFTVNGQRPNSNNVTIDGVTNLDNGTNAGYMATTNLDALAEVRILTNAYQAEYGRAVGGQVQLVTRSGTQSFHGSGYWYARRGSWNANSWTNKRAAAPPPLGIGQEIEPPDTSRNDFGYTIGGPIFVPRRFNTERRKLFFFWSQEFQRRSDPVGEVQGRVPTLLEREGDFSHSVDATGTLWPYVRDYATNLPCGPADTRGCYQHQGVLGRIPPDRLYQLGLNVLRVYPEPNFAGAGGLNYRSQTPSDMPRREELLRLDYQPAERWRLTARYMHNADTRRLPYGSVGLGTGSNVLDDVDSTLAVPGRNLMLSASGILDARTTLELVLGTAHNSIDSAVGNPRLRRAAAGLSELPLLVPDAVQQDYLPRLRFEGTRTGPRAGQYVTGSGPFTNENTTWDAAASLSRVYGGHSLKLGVLLHRSLKPQSPLVSFNGEISFAEDPPNPYDTGFSYANAATGVFSSYTQASAYLLPEWRYTNLEWYAQDNWRAGSRLTLDYGVRFSVLSPHWDATLQASTFLPSAFDPASAARLYQPVCIGAYPCPGPNRRGMDPALAGSQAPTLANTVDARFIGRVVPGTDRFNGTFQAGKGIDDTLSTGSVFRVAPRIGVAWDVFGRGATILRGGFGAYHDRPQGNIVFGQITNAPGMLQPRLQWGRLQDLNAAFADPEPTLVLAPTAFEFRPPRTHAWNVGMQQKLWRGLVLDVAYVGSQSKNLPRPEPINAVPLGAKFKPQNQDPTLPPSPIPGGSALPDDLLRPFPGYAQITMWQYDGYGNYHSLQASLGRRFEGGLMLNAFYVWSKALGLNPDDFIPGFPNATPEETRRVDYSYTSYDRRHNFVLSFVYQAPRRARGWLGVVANDWQLSGVYRWTSGRPYAIFPYNVAGLGAGNLSGSDLIPRVVLTGDPGSGWSGDPYRQLDASAIAPPQPGGDYAASSRYFLHGPPIDNLDLSLSKSFVIGKALRLELRVDAFNALNHTQFTGVNNVPIFVGGRIANLPYDAAGDAVRADGFGAVSGAAPPRTLQLVTRLTF
jgi:hypothetical protein